MLRNLGKTNRYRGNAPVGRAGTFRPVPVIALTEVIARALSGPDLAGSTLGPGRTRLICIDGPAGSGKTTLAGRLEHAAGRSGTTAATVHLDDLYDGWSALVGDRARELTRGIRARILNPLATGSAGRYRRYDWPSAAFAEEVEVPVVDLLVLEGCGSAQSDWSQSTALAIWVEVPPDLRTSRWLARDDDSRAAQQCRDWQRDEQAWFARDRTRQRADLLVDGAALTEPASTAPPALVGSWTRNH